MLSRPLALLLLLLPPAAAAQPIPFQPERTEACLADAGAEGARPGCIGLAADLCRRETPHATEVEAAACLAAETNWWRDRMTAALAGAEKQAALRDVEFARAISQGAPRMTEDLQVMQAAWKDWSEKRCFFEADRYRGRPDRMVHAADCIMRRTAEQALLLEEASRPRR